MKVAVITPVHPASLPYLAEAAASLSVQTRRADEWRIACNGGTSALDVARAISGSGSWARSGNVSLAPPELFGRIGALKAGASESIRQGAIVELDADDMLAPSCLSDVARAFESDPDVHMVYSDAAHFSADGNGGEVSACPPFRDGVGFTSYQVVRQGWPPLNAIAHPPVTAHSISSVLYAPDHVRAWRAESYHAIGGHDPELAIGDDLDLTQRIYLVHGAHGFRSLKQPLYYYRRHAGQRTAAQDDPRGLYATKDLGDVVERLYDERIESLALRWCKDEGLRSLDIGGGRNPRPGFEAVDLEGAAIRADLRERWPFADSSIGAIWASHVLEHLPDKLHVGRELYRVLAPGGWAFVEVPSALGAGAYQDPTHTSYWVQESFAYWSDAHFASYLPADSRVRFQCRRLETRNLYLGGTLKGRMVPVIRADLVAIKDGFRPPGPLHV